MKILMILMGLEIGGAETHVVELSKELKRRGREITVVSSGGVYTAELKAAGIRHVCLPTDSRHPCKMLKAYIGLFNLIKHEKFDVVHAHARIPAFLCSLIRRKLKFDFITTAHWVFKTGPLLNFLTNWGQRTIAVSDDIKRYLNSNYNVLNNHITVTVNGIDTEKFSSANTADNIMKEFQLNPKAKRCVYVSRIDIDRSAVAFLLVNIMEQICEKYPDFELLIVGGGNDFSRLNNAVSACNKRLGRKGVILAGPRVDINNFIACADIFVGVSRAVLEAMAAAKPVIIAGNEGYIGLFDSEKLTVGIETNFCCRGCKISTEEELLKDMLSCLGKTVEQQSAMGEYNRNIINEMYSVKKMADDCERAYLDLLSIDKQRPYDVLISGYYGYKNAGDDSLLYAIINNLTKEKPNIDITVLSANPSETRRTYGVRSVHRFNVFKILHYMRRTKLLISGGGSLLQDVTSTKSLYYYLYVIRCAHKSGMKTMVYASGIGPIKIKKNKDKTAKVLNIVDLITLREPASFDELKQLKVEIPPIYITTDPAFSLEETNTADVDTIFENEGIDKANQYFVVSVRKWEAADKDFNTKLAKLCDYIVENYNLKPLFIPMQANIDFDANSAVARHIQNNYALIKGNYSALQLIKIISNAKLVIGMRLHVLIYAAMASVPILGLSYDPKVDSMLAYLSQKYKQNVTCIDVETMKKYIDEIIANRGQITKILTAAVGDMKEKAQADSKYAVSLLN